MQAKSGVTPALFVWLAIIALALLTAFAFLCVAGYVWLSLQLGAVFAGLAMAGVFLLIALIGVIVFAVSRRRAQRARDPGTRRARASLALVAARSQDSGRRHAGWPHDRLGAHDTGGAARIPRGAMVARARNRMAKAKVRSAERHPRCP